MILCIILYIIYLILYVLALLINNSLHSVRRSIDEVLCTGSPGSLLLIGLYYQSDNVGLIKEGQNKKSALFYYEQRALLKKYKILVEAATRLGIT